MTIAEFTVWYMLRDSGEVLDVVEQAGVRLVRRDGADLLVGRLAREEVVRDGLDMASRVLALMPSDERLAGEVVDAVEAALPWVGWLDEADRREFAGAFVRTVSACRDTGQYGPMAKLLNRWKASAEIAQSPELEALLTARRRKDKRVALSRPGV